MKNKNVTNNNMESILLGSLAIAGYKLSKKDKNLKKNKKYNPRVLDSKYNSNMQYKMNKLERDQASNLVSSIKNRRPDFFKQFDELKFDSVNEPVGVNEANQTNLGIDPSQQRRLNLENGYSAVQDDLDYNVVSKEEFTHKNMTPNTSKRDYTIDDSRATRKLETFTGVNENYVPKQEKYPLFEPMKNLTYVNGMPVYTDYLDDRYLASSKNNNGNLPFTNNVVVRPGIDNENRQGLGAVYRVNPRTTDALRGDFNPKISYANKPLEVLKKGDFRGPDFNLTKYKLPDFREQTVDDLVAGRSDKWGSYKAGVFTNVKSQRNEEETLYGGHANNSNMGDGPAISKTTFEPSSRQELYNDPTHGVHGVDIKPVFTNAESYTNRENQRSSVNASQNGGASKSEGASYAYDKKNYAPLPTIREGTSHSDILGSRGEFNSGNTQYTDLAKRTIRETMNNEDVLGARGEFNSGNTQYADIAKMTIRETMNNEDILGARGEFNSGNTQYADVAKMTIRETTNNEDILGARGEFNSGNTQYADVAKITIRQSTLYSTPGMNTVANVPTGNLQYTDIAKRTIKESTGVPTPGMNTVADVQSGYTRDDTDEARPTIRQSTENTEYQGPIGSGDNYIGYSRDAKDKAKTTVRQTTLLRDYTGGLSGNVENPTAHTDAENMTIRETREISTYNRAPPGSKSLAGPQLNEKTVKMNCKKDSVYYVPHPVRPLDNNIMPSNVEPYHKHTFINKKPQLDYGNYYTNNIFVDTLKENPFVNDIFHQKNVKYDDYSLNK